MRKHKKHLDFEINLIPCIDLLSTCICFLLLTAVWLQVGTMNVKQAVGGQAAADTPTKPTLWVNMDATGGLMLEVRDSKSIPDNLRKLKIDAKSGKIGYDQLETAVHSFRAAEPKLITALIQPNAASAYEDIIDLMDRFKKEGMVDLGVSPL